MNPRGLGEVAGCPGGAGPMGLARRGRLLLTWLAYSASKPHVSRVPGYGWWVSILRSSNFGAALKGEQRGRRWVVIIEWLQKGAGGEDSN